jgi:hypothetical protein
MIRTVARVFPEFRVKKEPPAPAALAVPKKQDDLIIRGEDIENTLDSFFGLDNK